MTEWLNWTELPEEAFQAVVQEEGTQPEDSTLPDVRKQSTAFREAKTARIPGTQNKRKGSCTQQGGLQREREQERVLSIFAQGSLGVPCSILISSYVCRTYLKPRKKPPKRSGWSNPRVHRGMEIVLLTGQSEENTHNMQISCTLLSKILPQ